MPILSKDVIFVVFLKKKQVKFLNEIRIEKSKDLLLRGDLSILDVSLSVGFNNQNYYNTVFKKLINMTPLEYRNYFNQMGT